MLILFSQILGVRQRRVKLETSLGRRLRRMVAVLAALIVLHVAALLIFERPMLHKTGTEHGGEIVLNALWETMTTLLTVGYGDFAPVTVAGKVATMLLLYTGAVFIVANVASAAVELRMNRITRMREGTWRWKMRDHILIVNAPIAGTERYFVQLLRLLRADPTYRHTPVLILTDRFTDGLPDSIRDLGAVYFHGSPHDFEALRACGAETAKVIVLLAEDEHHPRSDSLNFDVLLELHETYTSAKVVSEVVEDASRSRFRRFGSHRVVRPTRAYPEFIVRAIASPGTEVLVEDLLSGQGSVTERFNVRINGQRWADLGAAFLHAGAGTLLGYVDDERNVVSNPDPHSQVSGRGVFVMVRPGRRLTRAHVQGIINAVEHDPDPAIAAR